MSLVLLEVHIAARHVTSLVAHYVTSLASRHVTSLASRHVTSLVARHVTSLVCIQPGTDVMIFKNIFAENLAKILAFFPQTTASFCK
jgi:hypothetical protein